MRREDTCESGTDAANAFQPFQIAEWAERVAIGDDASCERGADAWEAFDFGSGRDVDIDVDLSPGGRGVTGFAGAAWRLDEGGRLLNGLWGSC